METVYRDYSQRGVKFYYIYKALAHPETNGYVAPFNLEERLMHVAEARRTLGTEIPWICDSMENELKHAFGDRPNSEFVIDPDGQVLVSRQWSDPSVLRADLSKLVGAVKEPTQIADLEMDIPAPEPKAKTGVVERLKLPGPMVAAKVEPIETPGVPHYAKLRAEMGEGKLYLGFFLDPLYKVHWNNEAPVLQFEIDAPDGVQVTPASGKGPQPSVNADADPREFLIDIAGRSEKALTVKVSYFACDDAETFCKQVTQKYMVYLQRDADGGSRRAGNSRQPGAAGGRPNGARNVPMPGMRQGMRMVTRFDTNGDGALSAEELRNAPGMWRRLDVNQDGELSAEELGTSPPQSPPRNP